jgi:hypothetical protein
MDPTKPDADRPPGILTKKDRLYLQGEDVPETKQARYERRKGIRKRIRNALLDFQELWDLEPNERRKITSDMPSNTSLYTCLVHMFAFLRYCALDEGYDLEEIVASGVQVSKYEEGSTVVESEPGMVDVLEGVTVTIDPRYHRQPKTETILEQLREGSVLSHRELVALIGSGLLTSEDWDKLRKEYGPD